MLKLRTNLLLIIGLFSGFVQASELLTRANLSNLIQQATQDDAMLPVLAEQIQVCLETGHTAVLDEYDHNGFTPLQEAVIGFDPSLFVDQVDDGAGHAVRVVGKPAVVKALLDAGVDFAKKGSCHRYLDGIWHIDALELLIVYGCYDDTGLRAEHPTDLELANLIAIANLLLDAFKSTISQNQLENLLVFSCNLDRMDLARLLLNGIDMISRDTLIKIVRFSSFYTQDYVAYDRHLTQEEAEAEILKDYPLFEDPTPEERLKHEIWQSIKAKSKAYDCWHGLRSAWCEAVHLASNNDLDDHSGSIAKEPRNK